MSIVLAYESLENTQLLFVTLAAVEGGPSLLDLTMREHAQLKQELNAALREVAVVNVAASASEMTVQAYGPDADALWEKVEPVLRQLRVPVMGRALRRYGGPGAREVQVQFPVAAG